MAFLAVGEVNTGMWSVCFRQEGLWEFDVWFQGLATGPTTVRSLRDRAHTMCRRQRGSKAPLWCIVWNREKLFAIWNNPLKWFLGRRGVFEANGVCWERGPDGRMGEGGEGGGGKLQQRSANTWFPLRVSRFSGVEMDSAVLRDGLRAHISSAPSSLRRSIFVTPCVTAKCEKGFAVIGSRGDL